MRGRTSDTSAISMRPANSGKNRSRAVSRSAASTGLRVVAERHVGEADRAGRKQRDRDVAAQHQIEPGDGADFGLGGLAHGIGGNEQRHRAKRGKAASTTAAMAIPRRLKPVAAVTDRSSR